MRRRTTIIGIILCVMTVGCFDIFNFPKKPPFPVIAESSDEEIAAAQQFMEQYYEAVCRQTDACNHRPFQRCMEDFQPRIEQGKRLAEQGLWRLRDPAAKACLAAFPEISCGPAFLGIPECSFAIEGLVDQGGACELDYQCASGDCSRSEADECAPTGTCTGRAKDPVTCRTDSACATGLRCGGTCVAHPGRGESCSNSPFACGSPFFVCRQVRQEDGISHLQCLPPVAVGEACNRDSDCRQGAFCRGSFGDTSGVCRPFYREGEVCPSHSIYCAAGLQCQVAEPDAETGTCGAPKPLGADCVAGKRQCAAPGYCSKATGKCEDGAALNERCGDVNDDRGEYRSCKEGWCSGSGRYAKCVPQTKDGGACEASLQCEAGLECDVRSGRCVVEACR